MSWFRRDKPKIESDGDDGEQTVKTEGIFVKCPDCDAALYKRELTESHERSSRPDKKPHRKGPRA